jgi:hypothetical protein
MKELQELANALDAASKKGVFTLQESASIVGAISAVATKLERLNNLEANQSKMESPSDQLELDFEGEKDPEKQ